MNKSSWPKTAIAVSIILVVGLGAIFVRLALMRTYPPKPRPALAASAVSINGYELELEIAATPAERERGLGYRDSLAPDGGMLFSFSSPGKHGFWMKGMRFPLDIIYLRGTEIVETKENVQPSSFPVPFFPSVDVDAVVEVNAGWVKNHGVKLGDTLDFLPIIR
jgi:uncharacterized membrane protein (UPF0127 family)